MTSRGGKPTFRNVRDCFLRDYGIAFERVSPFLSEESVTFGRFARDGQWRSANYDDDELIEADVLASWCRAFGVDMAQLDIACLDGHLSVLPPPPPPEPN